MFFQTWSNFSRKISLISPYVWPKKSITLQLRVALCLFLLLFGRLINVALPLYSKWIGSFAHHTASAVRVAKRISDDIVSLP